MLCAKQVNALCTCVVGEHLQEWTQVAKRPDGLLLIVGIGRRSELASRRPAIQDRRAIELEVDGNLRRSIDRVDEAHVESVDEYECLLLGSAVDRRAQPTQELGPRLFIDSVHGEVPAPHLDPDRPKQEARERDRPDLSLGGNGHTTLTVAQGRTLGAVMPSPASGSSVG